MTGAHEAPLVVDPMLARYRIVRGRRPPNDPLPEGRRVDIRKHTSHVLAPEPSMVAALLEDPKSPERARRFEKDYRELLERRFEEDRPAFDAVAEDAADADVFLGCSCPTKRQPDVHRCHTVHALRFMQERYPSLKVQFPHPDETGY